MIPDSNAKHLPVLLHEVLEGLAIEKGDTVVDATLGSGGYTRAFCEAVGPDGVVVGIDQDAAAIRRTQVQPEKIECTRHLLTGNFRHINVLLKKVGVAWADAVAFDLGMSSVQLEDSKRGFSFQKDEPLIMTFKEEAASSDITAEQIVNNWSEESISNVLYGYGGERYARKLARAITEARTEKPIKTTGELVAIVEQTLPRREKIHPATRTFQALRIAVNDELTALTEGLASALSVLAPGGRIAVVSFHSLEDRIVKQFFRAAHEENRGMVITKKPITPTKEEIINNPRSRSAKLRIFEKY